MPSHCVLCGSQQHKDSEGSEAICPYLILEREPEPWRTNLRVLEATA